MIHLPIVYYPRIISWMSISRRIPVSHASICEYKNKSSSSYSSTFVTILVKSWLWSLSLILRKNRGSSLRFYISVTNMKHNKDLFLDLPRDNCSTSVGYTHICVVVFCKTRCNRFEIRWNDISFLNNTNVFAFQKGKKMI